MCFVFFIVSPNQFSIQFELYELIQIPFSFNFHKPSFFDIFVHICSYFSTEILIFNLFIIRR